MHIKYGFMSPARAEERQGSRVQLSVRYRFTGTRHPEQFNPGGIAYLLSYEHGQEKNLLAQILEIDRIVITRREDWLSPAQPTPAPLYVYSTLQASDGISESRQWDEEALSSESVLKVMYRRLAIRSEQFKEEKALLLGQLEASWSKINHLKSEVQSSETESDKLTKERNELKAETGRLTLELSNGLVGNKPQIIVSELEKRGSVRILHLEGSAFILVSNPGIRDSA
ncbi:hypothetical protein QFC20_007071 [Naganishia adeliensis]|uniref:Uncharacterized protein n=1 Tax=Naganishia adeliensis TaxID=92952 RepID=A0ACC2V524_9TREE|nr:hypothetical protein QFC20_007071 [Naganishia adeliensis]